MFDAEKVLENVRGFNGKREGIRNNGELSQEGKEKALRVLQGEIDAYYSSAVNKLKGEWKQIHERHNDFIEGLQELDNEQERQWNYARLNFALQTTKARLEGVKSPGELEEMWNNVAIKSPETRRAFLELAGVKAFSMEGGDAKRLSRMFDKELHELTTTPEIKEQYQKGSKLTGDVMELFRITRETEDFYHPGGVLSGNNPFKEMTGDIVFHERVIPETLSVETKYEFVEVDNTLAPGVFINSKVVNE